MKLFIIAVEENRGFEVTKLDIEEALKEIKVPECSVQAVRELK